MTDLSFRAVGPEVLAHVWPPFVVLAGVQVAFVGRILHDGLPHRLSAIAGVVGPVVAMVVLSVVFERAAEAALVSQGVPPWSPSLSERLAQVRWSMGPLLLVFGVAQVALSTQPRSYALVAGLTATSGIALSWALAIWLYLNAAGDIVKWLVAPGVLGLVAGLFGFVLSDALWVCVMLWRRRPVTVAARSN